MEDIKSIQSMDKLNLDEFSDFFKTNMVSDKNQETEEKLISELHRRLGNACDIGNMEDAMMLLEDETLCRHIKINYKNSRFFRWAISSGHVDIARYILKKSTDESKIDINAEDCYALGLACRDGYFEAVKYMASLDNVDLHGKFNQPIIRAATNDYYGVDCKTLDFLLHETDEFPTSLILDLKEGNFDVPDFTDNLLKKEEIWLRLTEKCRQRDIVKSLSKQVKENSKNRTQKMSI